MANGRCTIASDDGGLPLSQALPCKGGHVHSFVALSRDSLTDLHSRITTAKLGESAAVIDSRIEFLTKIIIIDLRVNRYPFRNNNRDWSVN